MDVKERKAFQECYKTSRDYKFYVRHEMSEKQIFEFKKGKYVVDCVNDGWEIWQAAKTQAEINEINFNIDQLVAENLYFRDKKWDENSAYTEGQTNMYLVKQAEIDELQKRINEALTYLRHIDSRGYGESVLSKILKGKQND